MSGRERVSCVERSSDRWHASKQPVRTVAEGPLAQVSASPIKVQGARTVRREGRSPELTLTNLRCWVCDAESVGRQHLPQRIVASWGNRRTGHVRSVTRRYDTESDSMTHADHCNALAAFVERCLPFSANGRGCELLVGEYGTDVDGRLATDERVMACHEMAHSDLAQLRFLGFAAYVGGGAAGIEPAARRRHHR